MITQQYYENAFSDGSLSAWSLSPLGQTQSDLEQLAYYRALGCFLQTDEQSIIDRRQLLTRYMLADVDDFSTSALLRYHDRLPISSLIPRILRNICTAYNSSPRRSFSDNLKEDIALNALYAEAKVDIKMKNIYQNAKLYGLVAVRPYYENGLMRLLLLTPDNFRVVLDEKRMPKALIYPTLNNDNYTYTFHYWNNDVYRQYQSGNSKALEIVNPYGRIPFEFLKFGDADEFYTAGMFENIEAQLLINKYKFLQTLSATFQGFPIAIATNSEGQFKTVSPDKIIQIEGVDANPDGVLPPSLEFVSPQSAYLELGELIKNSELKLLKDNGIPISMLESSGAVNSGLSRLIERQELIEMRYDDIAVLADFEKRFCDLVALVSLIDKGLTFNNIAFAIDYEDERIFLDPKEERSDDFEKMKIGLLHPLNFFKKWGDFDNNIDINTLKNEIDERKIIFNQLFGNDENGFTDGNARDGRENSGNDNARDGQVDGLRINQDARGIEEGEFGSGKTQVEE